VVMSTKSSSSLTTTANYESSPLNSITASAVVVFATSSKKSFTKFESAAGNATVTLLTSPEKVYVLTA